MTQAPIDTQHINSRTMSIEQRQARAIQRSLDQRAQVRVLPGRPGFYLVRSATTPTERYVVSAHDGIVECSCKSAQYGKPCWHAQKVRSRLIRTGGVL